MHKITQTHTYSAHREHTHLMLELDITMVDICVCVCLCELYSATCSVSKIRAIHVNCIQKFSFSSVYVHSLSLQPDELHIQTMWSQYAWTWYYGSPCIHRRSHMATKVTWNEVSAAERFQTIVGYVISNCLNLYQIWNISYFLSYVWSNRSKYHSKLLNQDRSKNNCMESA